MVVVVVVVVSFFNKYGFTVHEAVKIIMNWYK